MKQLIEVQNKNYDLKFDLKTLRHESEKSMQSLTKFNDAEFKFLKILTRKKDLMINVVLVIITPNITIKSQITFVKSSHKHRHMPTCYYCCKEGHLKLACPYIPKDNYYDEYLSL